MGPRSISLALRRLASQIEAARSPSASMVRGKVRSLIAAAEGSHYWDYPPSDPDEAAQWLSDDHIRDGVAYAAGWTGSGQGYGPTQAKSSWPECPGFDWDEGLPDWDTGIVEEDGYEYRTVLMVGDPYTTPPKEVAAWTLVESFSINPEPELTGEDGNPSGNLYIGEGSQELVYRKPVDGDEEETEEQQA